MSKPKYRWWGYVKNVVNDLLPRSDSADLTPEAIREWRAVQRAVKFTRQLPEGEKQVAIMNYVYQGKEKRTLKEAAAIVGVSENLAKEWHSDFLRCVGYELGFTVLY